MKEGIFCAVLCFSFFGAFAQSQTNNIDNKVKYGIRLGVHHYFLDVEENFEQENSPSIQVGIMADYSINSTFSIAPKIDIWFNESQVRLNTESTYKIMPVNLSFATHFVFKKRNSSLSPYCFLGPSLRAPVFQETDDSGNFQTKAGFAFDFGIGLEKIFPKFQLAPELMFSYGLSNINENPVLTSVRFHSVSLVFNFMG